MTSLEITLAVVVAVLATLVIVVWRATSTGNSLTVSLGADFRDATGDKVKPALAKISVRKNEFYVAFLDRRPPSDLNPLTAELITAERPSVKFNGVVAAIIRGQLGAAETSTVRAYAASTTFGFVTLPGNITYVVHFDHCDTQKVDVTRANGSPLATLDRNGFVKIVNGVADPETKITDNDTLAPLQSDIAKVLLSLRDTLNLAGVPKELCAVP